MNYLVAIDTTLQGAAMALANLAEPTPKTVYRATHSEVMGSAAAIGDLWRQCLQAIQAPANASVERVVISQGPGSFTGIKVGLSFVYGLQMANPNLRVKGVSSLELLAKTSSERHNCDAVMILPATRTHGFLAEANAQGVTSRLLELAVDLPRLKEQAAGRQTVLCRPWPALQEQWDPNLPQLQQRNMEQLLDEALDVMVAATAADPTFSQDFLPARYLRLSTAEEKLGVAAVEAPQ